MSVPFSEKSKDNQTYIEYHEEDVQDTVIQALLKQSYRMFTVGAKSQLIGFFNSNMFISSPVLSSC